MKYLISIAILFSLNALATKNEASADRKEIKKTVLAGMPDVQECYKQERTKDAKLNGKITLGWLIDETGMVTKTEVVENSTKNDMLAGCIAEKSKTWKFPAAPKGQTVSVRHPFTFTPN